MVNKLQVVENLTRHHGVNLAGVRHLLTSFTLLRKHKVELPDELRSIDAGLLEPTG
jgi:hypothetical protein